jgi:predicted membrane-bound spermidine synthase
MTRAELGFLFVVAAAALVAVIGAALTLLPLTIVGQTYTGGGRATVLAYFAAIGLAYLVLEMTYLSRLTYLIGDPVVAAAVTISGFLAVSGLGSLTAQQVERRQVRLLRWVIAGVVLIGAVVLLILPRSAAIAGAWPLLARCLLALAAVAPVAYLMGFPMPLALQRLDRAAPVLIPWAWGVNGFASVLAAPLATLIGMTWGFHIAAALALLLYTTSAVLFGKLPEKQ